MGGGGDTRDRAGSITNTESSILEAEHGLWLLIYIEPGTRKRVDQSLTLRNYTFKTK